MLPVWWNQSEFSGKFLFYCGSQRVILEQSMLSYHSVCAHNVQIMVHGNPFVTDLATLFKTLGSMPSHIRSLSSAKHVSLSALTLPTVMCKI